MTWTKLGDDFTDDPDLIALPRGVRLVHIEAMVWSNRHGTDGNIPSHVLRRITDDPDPAGAAEQLVAAGKWKTVDGGGWEIVDFLKDQLPAEEVRRTREAAADRQRRQRRHRSGDHSTCDARYCKEASRVTHTVTTPVTNGVTNGVSHGTPTRPVPTRSGPKEPGPGSGAADAAALACEHWNYRDDKPHVSADGDCLHPYKLCGATGLCDGCVRMQKRSSRPDARCMEHDSTAAPAETALVESAAS